MTLFVTIQMTTGHKCFGTHNTLVRFFSCVSSQMFSHISFLRTLFSANSTFKDNGARQGQTFTTFQHVFRGCSDILITESRPGSTLLANICNQTKLVINIVFLNLFLQQKKSSCTSHLFYLG